MKTNQDNRTHEYRTSQGKTPRWGKPLPVILIINVKCLAERERTIIKSKNYLKERRINTTSVR